jgi:hypothetical protein
MMEESEEVGWQVLRISVEDQLVDRGELRQKPFAEPYVQEK